MKAATGQFRAGRVNKARALRFDLGFILGELHVAHCELPARLVSNSNLPYREVLKHAR